MTFWLKVPLAPLLGFKLLQFLSASLAFLRSILCTMDPSHAELMTMTSASDIFAWLEATKELEDALTAAMGDPRSLRGWAHIPDSRFEAEVRRLKLGERNLTPAEEGQAGQVARIGTQQFWTRPTTPRSSR